VLYERRMPGASIRPMTQTLHEHDVTLKDAVTQELRWTPSIDSTKIGVSVVDGTVTLSGEVVTYPQKLAASRAAQRVRGVVAIAQEITVSDTWRGINDSDIATEAGEALTRNVILPTSVKVTVQNHTITLSGEVEWHYQREAAGHSVQHLKGVESIHNLITIRPKARAGDLKTAIEAALVRHAQLDSHTIGVTTNQAGAVTLRGTVRTWAERDQAENACWAAPGIMSVDNGLRVTLLP